jgi:hypothetical protein
MTAALPDPNVVPAPRAVPPDAPRWGWWTVGWIGWAIAFAALEGSAIWVNRHRQGYGDFRHRTLSENLWAVFAFHPDDAKRARYGRLRRLGFVTLMAWFDRHIRTDGREM